MARNYSSENWTSITKRTGAAPSPRTTGSTGPLVPYIMPSEDLDAFLCPEPKEVEEQHAKTAESASRPAESPTKPLHSFSRLMRMLNGKIHLATVSASLSISKDVFDSAEAKRADRGSPEEGVAQFLL